jgi:hypothetical protein
VPTDPKPIPTTFADLLTLPGWEPIYVDDDGSYSDRTDDGRQPLGARHRFGAHHVSAAYDLDGEESGWCSLSDGLSVSFREGDEESAVEWLLGMRALIEHAGAVALAAAAPPPPPTTIAELATRPGWRPDDGDAIHDGAYITAGPNIVELGLGDRVHALDEREAAEVAFAVAPLIAAAHVRYNANPDQE